MTKTLALQCTLIGGGVNRRTDQGNFENIFARILDSKQDFNGFPDPAIAADCGLIHFWGPDIEHCV